MSSGITNFMKEVDEEVGSWVIIKYIILIKCKFTIITQCCIGSTILGWRGFFRDSIYTRIGSMPDLPCLSSCHRSRMETNFWGEPNLRRTLHSTSWLRVPKKLFGAMLLLAFSLKLSHCWKHVHCASLDGIRALIHRAFFGHRSYFKEKKISTV